MTRVAHEDHNTLNQPFHGLSSWRPQKTAEFRKFFALPPLFRFRCRKTVQKP